MGIYDSKRLDVAIQYIRRMAEGRNPVNNRPAPENEVLTNINVNRCLKFVEEILTDVRSTGGVVGVVKSNSASGKPPLAEVFPYEVLSGFQYEQDQQISYFLKQIVGLIPEEKSTPVQATMVTDWLRENGYLEKRMFEDIGRENSVPTQKGTDLGIYAEKAGSFPNEYYRVYYNENAQRFIVDNFRRILTETAQIRARNRKERKRAALSGKQKKQLQDVRTEKNRPEAEPPHGPVNDEQQAFLRRDGFKEDPGSYRRNAFEEDPGFASLVSSIPAGFDSSQSGWSDPVPADSGGIFMGEGWESADDGLPW